MPSAATKRKKRSRFRPNWTPILALVLVGVVVGGLLFGPVTRITVVRVVGVPPTDRARVERILSRLRDVPCVAVDRPAIEGEILANGAVARADLARNPFGRARLVVAYREPVATLADGGAMDADGVVYPPLTAPEDLPVIAFGEAERPRIAAFLSAFPARRVARIATEAKRIAPGPIGLRYDRDGTVTLSLAGGVVELGDTDDLDRKLEVLRDRLARDPGELARLQRLILIAPDAPALVQKPRTP